jgi:ribosomal protein S4
LCSARAESEAKDKSEGDFRFSHLKRKWHAEEHKYLSQQLRRAQDLNVQQEMELEALRQQLSAATQALHEHQERLVRAHT